MDYARFLALRGPEWDAFEKALASARDGGAVRHQQLESLADAYRMVLHDHALAAARYPGTGAARRLQALALAGTAWLTAAEPPASRPFFGWTFPRAFRAQLPWTLVAAAIFAAAALLGGSLALLDPGVGLAFLGPEAEQGLREGRLWTESLLHAVPPAVSSSAIATNNMAVALTAFAGGTLAGLGALYVLLMNGFLLGAVLACTSHFGLAGGLLEFVSAHGPLELSLIVITAAAGLSMGHALVAPDDRPRGAALAEAGRAAVAVLLGCLPWFLVLGVVEAFVSPSPELPAALKAAIGLALLTTFLVLAWNPALADEDP